MPELEKIRIGLGALSANQCIPWLAQEAGLFREEGLDAVITFEPPAKRTLQVVFEDIVDVCTFGGYPVVRAAVEGKAVEIILNLNDFNHLGIVAQNGIEKPGDLKGRKIGGFSLKGNADFTLDLMFAQWGLTGKDGGSRAGSLLGRLPGGVRRPSRRRGGGGHSAAALQRPGRARGLQPHLGRPDDELSGRGRVRAPVPLPLINGKWPTASCGRTRRA